MVMNNPSQHATYYSLEINAMAAYDSDMHNEHKNRTGLNVIAQSGRVLVFALLALLPGLSIAIETENAADFAPIKQSNASHLLHIRNAEFSKEIIKVGNNVYTAVGYAVSPVSMIVGPSGVVIIDTGINVAVAKQIRLDFAEISDKPVKAIILTHGHGDHTRGVSEFIDAPNIQVWAHQNYGHEARHNDSAGLTIQSKRAARQAGFMLAPEKRINNGIAKAFWPNQGGTVFKTGQKIQPTHLLNTARQTIEIAGISLDLVKAEGETDDQLFVVYPAQRVLFSGDNFYKSWPNLYPIRGAAYRDILSWTQSLEKMIQESPKHLVGGHTRPISGAEEVATTLTNYHDAILFVFEKTIEGMNKGLTPDQLVGYVKLPEKYQNLDYLRPYYGHPEWAIRSIFNGYLGWFDGNASNLFPLSKLEEAKRIASMVGGFEVLAKQAAKAFEKGDHQWTSQLCDHLLTLDPAAHQILQLKASALEMLAEKLLTATGRNYYFSEAQELRKQAGLASGKE